jgi:hypothetical protein
MANSKEKNAEGGIEQLFGSKTRVKLLRLFLDTPDRSYYVRELTRRIDAQLNSVRRELKNLVSIGIVLEVEGKILPEEADEEEKETKKKKANDRKKYYQANQQFTFFSELKRIMKKSAVLVNKSFVQKVSEAGKIDLLLLTGKFIDRDDIPSDLLIVGEIKAKDLHHAIALFEEEVGQEINYTHMPKEEFLYRREVADRFLESLLVAQKNVLINEIDPAL